MLPEKKESPAEHALGPILLKLKQDGPIIMFMPPPDTSAPLDDILEFIIAMQCDTAFSTIETWYALLPAALLPATIPLMAYMLPTLTTAAAPPTITLMPPPRATPPWVVLETMAALQ